MRAGEFPDGSRTLRAKIDMASPNLNMRDPVMYRILHADAPPHRRQVVHLPDVRLRPRPVAIRSKASRTPSARWNSRTTARSTTGSSSELGIFPPQQIEFARLNLTYTVMSKRKLLQLVQGGPRQRLGRSAHADHLRACAAAATRPRRSATSATRIGVAKTDSIVDMALLEHCVREDLNKRAPRVMAVLRPLKVVIDNYPEGQVEEMDAVNNPEDPSAGTRKVPFSRVLYIEQDDFREDAAARSITASRPGSEVRLRYAYFVTLHRRGEGPEDGRGDGSPLHLRSGHARRQHARRAQGERRPSTGSRPRTPSTPRCASTTTLFTKENPDDNRRGEGLHVQPEPALPGSASTQCKVEPCLANAAVGSRYQFERLGYFCVDLDSTPGKLVFNRTVTLKDTWAKIAQRGK